MKTALVNTEYPGASALEVEEEVTLPVEKEIQSLPYVDYVTSISSAGLSQITVEMKPIYREKDLKQIWDELRRKTHDIQPRLPREPEAFRYSTILVTSTASCWRSPAMATPIRTLRITPTY